MALRFSTGTRSAVAGPFGWRAALANGRLKIYTGAQPASADDATTGTLLATFTLSGGAFTAETRPTATLTLSGASGSVDTVTVGDFSIIENAVNYTSDLTTTAAALATEINNSLTFPDFTATSSTATVTIYAPYGLGAGDGQTVATTSTTLAVSINGGSSSTLGGTGATAGVSAVNGLNWAYPDVSGVLSKESTTWQATAAATGTAGWFRFEADGTDDQGSSTTYRRFDGSIGTSGADMILSNLSITSGSTQTINTFTLTIPAS
jgi:hypothetical protein